MGESRRITLRALRSSTRRVLARSPSPRSRTFSAPSARSSSRTRPPSSASSSALSLMRRTTSATWSSLTSSSPPPPKSLSTRLPIIAEFQEFPGNRKKRTNGTAKAPHAEKYKKRPQHHLAPQMRTSNPDTLRTRNIGTKFSVSLWFPIHSFGDRSSVIISVESIDLTFVFFSFSFVVFFLVRKLAYANYLLSY